jgi:hypothetical protein
MSDIFGSVGAPRWQSSQEMQMRSAQLGLEEATPFTDAFSSAFDKAHEQASPLGQARIKQAQAAANAEEIALNQQKREAEGQIEDFKALGPLMSMPPDKLATAAFPKDLKSKWGWETATKLRTGSEIFNFQEQVNDLRSQAQQLKLQETQMAIDAKKSALDATLKEKSAEDTTKTQRAQMTQQTKLQISQAHDATLLKQSQIMADARKAGKLDAKSEAEIKGIDEEIRNWRGRFTNANAAGAEKIQGTLESLIELRQQIIDRATANPGAKPAASPAAPAAAPVADPKNPIGLNLPPR